MTEPKSANPATGSVNGVRSSEQVAARLRLQATSTIANIQVLGHSTTREQSGRGCGDISVELSAIDPDLRSLVRRAIKNHLPEHEFAILKAAEDSERETLRMLIGGALNGGRQ
jgi:DNA-binding FrmR family transcriptional regulator